MSSITNLESSMFHGLTSEILDFASVRGSTVGNLMHHLTFFGAGVGSYPHVEWRGKIYADINCILVGTTGSGKGESLGIIRELYTFPSKYQDLLAPTRDTSLTSGKRSIQAIHSILEEYGNGETRILSIDEEFASLLSSASRTNNTLAQTLIKFIDGAALSEYCNGRLIKIPELHFASVGHIPPEVLTKAMSTDTFFNGLGNRFLFMEVPTREYSESDGHYSEDDMCHLRQKLIESLGEGGTRTRVEMDEGARDVYLNLQRSLPAEACSKEIRALQQRLPLMCLKLALTLTLVNREESITRQTMEEANALIDYSRKTIARSFGPTQVETPEQVVLRYLEEHGRTQRTTLTGDLSKRLPRKLIDAVLTTLISRRQVIRTTETIARGRRPEFFELTPAVQVA